MDTITRRDAIKITAGLVIGAGLAGGTVETGAAGASPRPDFAAVLRWEEALAAADKQGERWVEEAHILRCLLTVAANLAEETGIPAIADPLRAMVADVEAVHAEREEEYAAWGAQAWYAPDLGLLPPMPWR
ncbi:MAG: hypothetical protein M3R02_18955 [Chloroflexota bacterium]|nr:hypothetical protein [Chloroflexota bacterium]